MKEAFSKLFGQGEYDTWVFAGGTETAGDPRAIGTGRCFAAQFEEYIRWTIAWEREGDAACQRYVFNLGRPGFTAKDILRTFGERIAPLDPAAVCFFISPEDAALSLGRLEAVLAALLQKTSLLRGGSGLAVLLTPYPKGEKEADLASEKAAEVIQNVVNALPDAKKDRVAVVDFFHCLQSGDFLSSCLNLESTLNARGHLRVAQCLAQEICGLEDARGVPPFGCAEESDSESPLLEKFPMPSGAIARLRARLKEETPLFWLMMGDSVTHGAQKTGRFDAVAQHLEKRLKFRMGRVDDMIGNTAVSGAETEGTIQHLDARLGRFHPDVVSIMLGTNDGHVNKSPEEGGTGKGHTPEVFKRNLRSILGAICEKGKDVTIVLCTPTPNLEKERTDVPKMAQAVRELAKEAPFAGRTVLIDQYAFWDGILSAEPGLWKRLFPDGVHPGAEGHVLLAGMLASSLDSE